MPRSILLRPHLWLAAPLLVSLGCGAGQTGRPADPAQAEQALNAVLDAWKRGEPPDTLARRTPPIHVSDLDWTGGLRLERYKADQAGRLVGFDMNYPVVLQLKGPLGKALTKKAVYTVSTQPELLVLRQEN
jgi:hypothetical protein